MAPATTAPATAPATTPGPHPQPRPRRHWAEASVAVMANVAATAVSANRPVNVFLIGVLSCLAERR